MGKRSRPPAGWISAYQAQRRFGLSDRAIEAILRRGWVRPEVYFRGKPERYAPVEAWREAARRWEAEHAATRRRERATDKARRLGPPKPLVDPETARRRVASLTEEQRLRLRVFYLAIQRGFTLPVRWSEMRFDVEEKVS